MSSIFFKCPVCGYKEKETILEDTFSTGDLVECPECLNILVVEDRYRLKDFKDILADQVEKRNAKKQSKVVGKWDDKDAITVRYL